MPQGSQTHMKEFTVLMALLMSIVAISIDALLPALGYIGADLLVENRNHVQFVITAIFIGMAIGQLISGPLSDAFGRKPVLYAGIVLYLCGSLVCYFAPSLPILLIGRFIQGLGVSGPFVSAMSIVRDKFVGREMAKIMSLVMMIFMMVPALAPSLGQGILLVASWRMIFFVYIGYAILVGTWIYFRLEETLPRERRLPFHVKNIMAGVREVFATHSSVCYMVCSGICFGGLIGYLNSSQQIFQDMFGAGKMFAVYFGMLAGVMGISSLTNSRFVEKLGMRYICLRSFAVITAVSILFLVLHAFVTDIKLWMFLLYAAVLFFSFGLIFGNMNALSLEPLGHIAGIASAIIGSVSSIMSLTIGSVIGQMYNGTLIPMLIGFSVLGFLSIGMMKLAVLKKQPVA